MTPAKQRIIRFIIFLIVGFVSALLYRYFKNR
jgi:hypothetical protein